MIQIMLMNDLKTTLALGKEYNIMDKVVAYGVVSNCVYVNVRKRPSLESDIVSILDIGTTVSILSEHSKFYRIKLGDLYGFIMKEYIAKSAVIPDE